MYFLSFRQKPESSPPEADQVACRDGREHGGLELIWTPVFTGVTTFYETIILGNLNKKGNIHECAGHSH
jgi:hypothetical protein